MLKLALLHSIRNASVNWCVTLGWDNVKGSLRRLQRNTSDLGLFSQFSAAVRTMLSSKSPWYLGRWRRRNFLQRRPHRGICAPCRRSASILAIRCPQRMSTIPLFDRTACRRKMSNFDREIVPRTHDSTVCSRGKRSSQCSRSNRYIG